MEDPRTGPYDRVVRYLSQEWIAAADEAVRAAAAQAPPGQLVIDQHVTDVVSYRIRVSRGDCSVSVPVPDTGSGKGSADATFTQGFDTAQAVASGETDAHQAFLLGRITFTGDADVLIQRRDAFTWLAEALAPVMAATDFD